jgi:hypothetical protein
MSTANVLVPFQRIQEAFQSDAAKLHDAVYQCADKAAGGDPAERARLVAEWNEAISALEQDDKGAAVLSSPQNALASRLQTLFAGQSAAADKVAATRGDEAVFTPAGETLSPGVLEVKFDNEDLVGWLGVAWKLIFKPDKHAWITPRPVAEPFADDARIAVFSDWGTGLYGAPVIASSIATKLDRCDVALHLGDTYYSGSDNEIADRLINDWPKRSGTINRSLNGNHEMYSGGQGYFRALGSFFNQPASCFAMQNASWILICLDTAYVDFDLDQRQVAWVKSILGAAGSRKLILFSHHQPFSQLDAQGPKLQTALADLLEKQSIHAWYWGHEHRLVLYEPHPTWGFKGRCVGHGGFPGFRDNLTSPQSNNYVWVQVPAKPHVPAAKILDGPNFWVTEDPMAYNPHGYLTLDFDGGDAWETYRTPDNIAVSERMKL